MWEVIRGNVCSRNSNKKSNEKFQLKRKKEIKQRR